MYLRKLLVLVGLISWATSENNESETIKWTFSVKINGHRNEFVGITGEDKALGSWNLKQSILLHQTFRPNINRVSVFLPRNTRIYYRFFTCLVDDSGNRQIKFWETHRIPRVLEPQLQDGSSLDNFGVIDGVEQIAKGWLTTETAIQLKFYNNPFVFEKFIGDKISIHLQPIDMRTSQNILSLAKADVKYSRYGHDDSKFNSQPSYGVPFDTDDIVIFRIIAADPSKVLYRLKVFSQKKRLIGQQYILPENISGDEGTISVNIVGPSFKNVIGNVSIDYLVTKPLPNPQMNFHGSMSDYWGNNWTLLDIGHRGLGANIKISNNSVPIENIVASMKQAAVEGADAVEFDVHLTQDLIPIIYHDFYVYISLNENPTKLEDLTKVNLNEITYEKLKSLKTYQVVGENFIEYPSANSETKEDFRLFPTFEEFFEKIPKSVGFDIEVKWPQMMTTGPEANQTIGKNVFVDKITEILLTKGCGRLIFLTSFDADICTMFRIKQNMYPVAFLSYSNSEYIDPRTKTVKDALNHAQAFDLIGIAPETTQIIPDPSQVKMVLDDGKQIFIWGNVKTEEDRTFFRELNVTALIYDRIDLLKKEYKDSMFEDIQENGFFDYQCLNFTFGE